MGNIFSSECNLPQFFLPFLDQRKFLREKFSKNMEQQECFSGKTVDQAFYEKSHPRENGYFRQMNVSLRPRRMSHFSFRRKIKSQKKFMWFPNALITGIQSQRFFPKVKNFIKRRWN